MDTTIDQELTPTLTTQDRQLLINDRFGVTRAKARLHLAQRLSGALWGAAIVCALLPPILSLLQRHGAINWWSTAQNVATDVAIAAAAVALAGAIFVPIRVCRSIQSSVIVSASTTLSTGAVRMLNDNPNAQMIDRLDGINHLLVLDKRQAEVIASAQDHARRRAQAARRIAALLKVDPNALDEMLTEYVEGVRLEAAFHDSLAAGGRTGRR